MSITIGDAADDARLRAVLEAVSQMIDDECQRTFQPYRATRYFTAQRVGGFLLDDDLLSVATFKSDPDGARTYPTVWAVTDYDVGPRDQPPYWEISVRWTGGNDLPVGVARGVEVAGTWGYREDLLPLAATIQGGGVSSSATALTLSTASDGLEVGQTILAESEQMYVVGVNGTALTVERGANGTTAVAHAAGVALALYRYPAPIVEATRIQAARLFQRVHAPFGVTGSAELGTAAVISRIDPDVKMLIQHYRSGVGMVA